MTITRNKQNILVSIWDKMDNKKTIVGILLYFVYRILISRGVLVEDPSIVLAINGIIGIGATHKVQKIIDKI